MSNRVETLGGFIRRILDVNKDGVISFRDFLALFPNNAVAVAVLFVDAAMLIAEYRVFDVGMRITDQNVYKALGFVLVSAVPFYLGELLWLYPQANFGQKAIAVGFVAGGLYTSALFGLADLSQSYDVSVIVSRVVYATIVYIVLGLVYILIDPNIRAWRAMVTAQGALELELKYQNMARTLLTEWQKTQKLERETIDLFGGDEEAVIAQLTALRGKKPKQNDSSRNNSSTPPFAAEKPQDTPKEKRATSFTLQDYLAKSGMTLEQAQVKFGGKRYSDFAADCNPKFDYINGDNMRAMFAELTGDTNPTRAVTGNHRR